MIKQEKILIISPHTDDAELGCGGTISRFIRERKRIYWVVFSTAEDSLPVGFEKDTLRKEFEEVINEFGLEEYKIYSFKVRYIHEKRQEILEELIKIRKEFAPDLVISPSLNDFHQDHIAVANECIRAFKTNASIICYELPWNHINFNTLQFIKLNEKDMEKKWKVLQKYKTQLLKQRNYFSEEYIKGLARVRGTQCNSKYAEAFEVIRWIV
ncbi:LmbE family protein [groundwater metagenome]|uniref:LmbE family protein n=1 Tax=groundwater metagenome TaxID=717931 RepID=A0A098E5S3_9ZZZZ